MWSSRRIYLACRFLPEHPARQPIGRGFLTRGPARPKARDRTQGDRRGRSGAARLPSVSVLRLIAMIKSAQAPGKPKPARGRRARHRLAALVYLHWREKPGKEKEARTVRRDLRFAANSCPVTRSVATAMNERGDPRCGAAQQSSQLREIFAPLITPRAQIKIEITDNLASIERESHFSSQSSCPAR